VGAVVDGSRDVPIGFAAADADDHGVVRSLRLRLSLSTQII
jgi:hypothetical protein